MAPSREAWAAGFLVQSRSDWEAYKVLAADASLPPCHALHYLQMASEKIAKAYRCRDTGASLNDLLHRHVGFEKFIISFLLSPIIQGDYRGRGTQLRQLIKNARRLAREIEKLAPAVDRAWAPENAEYPWAQGETVVAPCSYEFPALSLLTGAGGRTFLNFVARAIRDFEQIEL